MIRKQIARSFAASQARDLLSKMLVIDPAERITVDKVSLLISGYLSEKQNPALTVPESMD